MLLTDIQPTCHMAFICSAPPPLLLPLPQHLWRGLAAPATWWSHRLGWHHRCCQLLLQRTAAAMALLLLLLGLLSQQSQRRGRPCPHPRLCCRSVDHEKQHLGVEGSAQQLWHLAPSISSTAICLLGVWPAGHHVVCRRWVKGGEGPGREAPLAKECGKPQQHNSSAIPASCIAGTKEARAEGDGAGISHKLCMHSYEAERQSQQSPTTHTTHTPARQLVLTPIEGGRAWQDSDSSAVQWCGRGAQRPARPWPRALGTTWYLTLPPKPTTLHHTSPACCCPPKLPPCRAASPTCLT